MDIRIIEVSASGGVTVEDGIVEAIPLCWQYRCDVLVEHNGIKRLLKFDELNELVCSAPKETKER